MLSAAISCLPHTRVQTSAAVHGLTAGAENGKPLSCDGKTECIISICVECGRSTGGAATDHLHVQWRRPLHDK